MRFTIPLLAGSAAGVRTSTQQELGSFPTAIWDEVDDEAPSCDELMGDAQDRMKSYMQTCGLNPQTDRDSGATSFTLFRSGAEKLCNCGLDTESIKDAAKAMADCPTNQMSGPLKVLDTTFLECKAGKLDLNDYKEQDGKLGDESLLEKSRSFPTAIWDEVEDETPSCEELMGEAQDRMKSYMQTCGLNPQTDRDSGATSFTLFRSGAEKLCSCGLNTESIKDAAKAMSDCPTNQMSGPLKVLDNTYLECKAGKLDLNDYKEQDGKLGDESLLEKSRSFPTAIWDEVEDETPSCEELMGEAQDRMKSYMQTCGLNPQTDRDSGATSFTLFRSGAEKLCSCGLNTESIKDAAKAMADCPTNQMSGPLKVLDNTYLECKAGNLDLNDYKEKDGKLGDES